jgi:hypothetical protein
VSSVSRDRSRRPIGASAFHPLELGYASKFALLIDLTARQHVVLNSAAALTVLSLGVLPGRWDRREMALLANDGGAG